MTQAGDDLRRLRDGLHEALVLCDAAIAYQDALDDRELEREQYQARLRRVGDHLRLMRLDGTVDAS